MFGNIKYYLVYLLIFLFGASLAAGIRFTYDFSVVEEIGTQLLYEGKEAHSLRGYVLFAAEFLKPLMLVFLSAFTIYACATGAVASLFTGAEFGILLIRSCTSKLNPFTHAAALIFLLSFAFLYTTLCTNAALYRNTIRTAAPSPRELLKIKDTTALFYLFICIAVITVAVSTALYFFVLYFPI